MIEIMKRILILFAFVALLASCSDDFLDKKPTTSSVVENFYKTPNDATQALTAVYNMLTYDDWWSKFILADQASDDCAGGGGSGDGGGYQISDRGLTQPGSIANGDAWGYYYGGIYRANTYIQNEALIDWNGNETLEKQYLAEARFLRGYMHFYLAQMFGEIPAYTKIMAPDIVIPRTPAADLYKIILDDFKYCVENGLSDPYSAMKPGNWGRATKWAAEAMMGRVFLYYTGYYNQTSLGEYTNETIRDYVEDCIKNSGHDLVPEYASLWRVSSRSELGGIDKYAGERNPECVWSVTYDIQTATDWNKLQRMYGPRNYNVEPYGNGWGAIPVLPTLWKLYNDADSRKRSTILSWAEADSAYDYVGQQQAQYTGYNTKKYMISAVGYANEVSALGGASWQTKPFEDFMIMRFSDVLLMGAEYRVITNGAGDATALGYLNRVRERAFGSGSYNYSTASIENIMAERRFELACEGIRFYDLLRSCKGDFSKLVPYLNYDDQTDGGDFSNTTDAISLDVDGNNWATRKGLFQIPQDQLEKMNGLIEQNPGY
jgi:starch-binding outer membrane protein, SusD/RagB family